MFEAIDPKPFVKWAGGKRQIIDKIKEFAPKEFKTYYEPFVGGGAVLFALRPNKAVINDYNSELINVYKCLSTNVFMLDDLIKQLKINEKNHDEENYYEIRNFDRKEGLMDKLSSTERAARTIYLNKSCFNGLYRVNSNGQFNVPFNKKKEVKIFDKKNLEDVYTYLSKFDINILNGDFEDAVKTAKKGDFVYFDPPYDTLNDESFTSYTDKGFNKEDQKRLFECYKRLDKKGVYVMLSNHNTPFINELYKDYNIKVISAKRNINSNGSKRGSVEETIITNY
ncbi:MAG: DNA adenine methylase [Bacilli bacterium]|nr:DNA adenine methylase [Bacilli bacterium]